MDGEDTVSASQYGGAGKERRRVAMSKKRNCRRTPEEQAIHDKAVRLRKMTDQQLVFEFRRAAIREERSVCTSEDADNISGVQMLIHAIADGKCNGIKNGIACRVAQFAAELGLL